MRVCQNYNLNLPEPDEGWEALNLEALSKSVVLSGIDLGDVEWWVLSGEFGSCGSIFRGKLLAVATIDISN